MTHRIQIAKKGFTLAEVLITIGIIGVIAAMTIPTLINNTNKVEAVTALKKSYAILSQVHEMLAADNGSFADAVGSIASSEGFANIFAQKMKVVKNCGPKTEASDCFTNAYKKIDNSSTINFSDLIGDDFFQVPSKEFNPLITADGMAYAFALTKDSTCSFQVLPSPLLNQVCGLVGVDINGPNKNPNKIGRDLFVFWITRNGIYPCGTEADNDKNIINDDCNPTGTPPSTQDGFYCAKKIFDEGAMNY